MLKAYKSNSIDSNNIQPLTPPPPPPPPPPNNLTIAQPIPPTASVFKSKRPNSKSTNNRLN